MDIPCKKCGLRYSSYCIQCRFRAYGIYGDKPTEEQKIKLEKEVRKNGV